MILPILLCYITGLLILLVCKQHKHLNIFEMLGFWFGIGISLFVLEMILQTLFLGTINLFPSVASVILLCLIFAWKIYKKEYSFLEYKDSWNRFSKGIWSLWIWKKIAIVVLILVSMGKLWLSLQTNISHPTLGEDAVTGWDLKTKVFFENRSIVLDKENPENLWGELKRSIFAPLTDLFFLLSYKEFPVGYSNIVSWLIYFNMFLLLFGILLRKFDIFIASIGWYMWLSLPIVYIHSTDAYFNLVSGYFLFAFAFYISDQIIIKKEKNLGILIPLSIFVFLDSSIRSESLLLVSSLLAVDFVLLYRTRTLSRGNILSFLPVIFWIMLSWAVNKYFHIFSPVQNIMSDSFDIFSMESIQGLFTNLGNGQMLTAPFSQAFYHPDYNLLYLLLVLVLGFIFVRRSLFQELNTILIKTGMLYVIFLSILFMVPAFGLLDAYAFIRYPMALSPFIVYICMYGIGKMYSQSK